MSIFVHFPHVLVRDGETSVCVYLMLISNKSVMALNMYSHACTVEDRLSETTSGVSVILYGWMNSRDNSMSCRVGWGHVQKFDFLYFLKLESCTCDVKRYTKFSYSSMIELRVPPPLKPGGSAQKCSNIAIFITKHLRIY